MLANAVVERLAMTGRVTSLALLAGVISGCTVATPPASWTFDHGAVIRADTAQQNIALVFTGGDHGQATKTILDILDRQNVKASFFLTGGYLANPDQRALVPRMLAEEHYVGPHSDAHPLYCSWENRSDTLVSRAFFESDLRRNIDDLRSLGALSGGETVYFIPPYEWYNHDQVEWATAMDVRLFNFTPGSGSNRDWIPETDAKFLSSEAIVSGVLDYEQSAPDGLNGFVLLFHLGSTRIDLMDHELGPLISAIKTRGYRFVRIDQLLE